MIEENEEIVYITETGLVRMMIVIAIALGITGLLLGMLLVLLLLHH